MDNAKKLAISSRIQQSKKYQHLSLETIQRIVDWAAYRYKEKEVEKQVKKKLHQVFGAYFSAGEKAALEKRMEAYDSTNKEQGTRNDEIFFPVMMDLHASSRERGGIVTQFYRRIFEVAEKPLRVVDLACGLNPFSYPWLVEAVPGVHYQGYDIDLDTTGGIHQFFEKKGLPVAVGYNDLFISVPAHEPGDTVMLLKTLPCLEQQEKGISARILSQLICNQLIISFPAKSLGGKEKGMVESYRAFLMDLIEGSDYGLRGELLFENETVYVLLKK